MILLETAGDGDHVWSLRRQVAGPPSPVVLQQTFGKSWMLETFAMNLTHEELAHGSEALQTPLEIVLAHGGDAQEFEKARSILHPMLHALPTILYREAQAETLENCVTHGISVMSVRPGPSHVHLHRDALSRILAKATQPVFVGPSTYITLDRLNGIRSPARLKIPRQISGPRFSHKGMQAICWFAAFANRSMSTVGGHQSGRPGGAAAKSTTSFVSDC